MNRRTSSALLILLLVAGVGAAQEQEASHIVRPGDTLRGLTRQFLGSADRWQENWRLNPEIQDPNLLVPGQRIRILVPRTASPLPTARVVLVSGDVEERPAPVDWLGAQRDDILIEKDGLRTGDASSSTVRFTDGTHLSLTEGSLVFLRRAGRSLEGVDERSVEIVEGQAELESIEPAALAADIEIVVGNTTAKPVTGDAGELQARARRAEGGGAAVMMYEGSSEVEAAGSKVAVERGMGTAVPEAGPPAPPEKLLPAPRTLSPTAGSRLPYPDPEFSWSLVEGAVSYVLELCADSECQRLSRRVKKLDGPTWRASPLTVATHHWRVTAVSPSGLDGYPSETSEFAVLSDRRDEEAPVADFELAGPRIDADGKTFYGPSLDVRVQVADEPAGVAEWRPLIDGEAVAPEDLAGGWSHGDHAVDVTAADRLGNRATRTGPRFTVDAQPPRLVWEVGGEEALDELLPQLEKAARWERRLRSWQRRERRALRRRNADPAIWAVVAWTPEALEVGTDWTVETLRWRERRRHQTLSHAGVAPVFLLVAPRLVVPGTDGPLGDELVLLRAVDDGARVRLLSARTVRGASGPELELETVDRLGNRRLERAPFLPADRAR